MQKLHCEICGSTNIIKKDGIFVCDDCGCEYSADELKSLIGKTTANINGYTVDINSDEIIGNLYILARRAFDESNFDDSKKYYDLILIRKPDDAEAHFFISLYVLLNECSAKTYNKCVSCNSNKISNALFQLSANSNDYLKSAKEQKDKTPLEENADRIFRANITASNTIFEKYSQFPNGKFNDSAQVNLHSRITGLAIDFIFDFEREVEKTSSDDLRVLYTAVKTLSYAIAQYIEWKMPEYPFSGYDWDFYHPKTKYNISKEQLRLIKLKKKISNEYWKLHRKEENDLLDKRKNLKKEIPNDADNDDEAKKMHSDEEIIHDIDFVLYNPIECSNSIGANIKSGKNIRHLFKLARTKKDEFHDLTNAEAYYKTLFEFDPSNWEAFFYYEFFAALQLRFQPGAMGTFGDSNMFIMINLGALTFTKAVSNIVKLIKEFYNDDADCVEKLREVAYCCKILSSYYFCLSNNYKERNSSPNSKPEDVPYKYYPTISSALKIMTDLSDYIISAFSSDLEYYVIPIDYWLDSLKKAEVLKNAKKKDDEYNLYSKIEEKIETIRKTRAEKYWQLRAGEKEIYVSKAEGCKSRLDSLKEERELLKQELLNAKNELSLKQSQLKSKKEEIEKESIGLIISKKKRLFIDSLNNEAHTLEDEKHNIDMTIENIQAEITANENEAEDVQKELENINELLTNPR